MSGSFEATAASDAPEEMPTKIPRPSRRALRSDGILLGHWMTPSMVSRWRFFGTKPAPIP